MWEIEVWSAGTRHTWMNPEAFLVDPDWSGFNLFPADPERPLPAPSFDSMYLQFVFSFFSPFFACVWEGAGGGEACPSKTPLVSGWKTQ